MAFLPWLKEKTTVIVLPHAEVQSKKVNVPHWAIFSAISAAVILVTGFIVFSFQYFDVLNKVVSLKEVVQTNMALQKENAKYEQQSAAIIEKIDRLEFISDNFSVIAGVDPIRSGGMGDIENSKFNHEILDRDLPISSARISDISDTLNKVERRLYNDIDILDHTPTIWPLKSTEMGRIGDRRGMRYDRFVGGKRFHHGLDVIAQRGTQVVATANGTIIYAARLGTMGNVIKIDHGKGFQTYYGHLSGYNVKVGDSVRRGDVIGFVGSTGKSTGDHLHYEVRVNGKDRDPEKYILNYRHDPVWDFEALANRN
jgi:murein DD-endopeptidase MepM/ murein hydrolase activator NlpD